MKNFLNRALGICFAFIIVLASISLSVPDACLTVSAHSGQTDASGGHHDYKNKSGLGPYHYHHGYSAHLHENGVCPYDSPQPSVPDDASPKASVPNTAPVITSVPDTATDLPDASAVNAAPAATVPTIDYNLVFDATFYAAANPDIAAIYGTDPTLLFYHFLTSGMREGRQGNASFNVWTYRTEHPELAAVFNDDLTQYYIYYCTLSRQGHTRPEP